MRVVQRLVRGFFWALAARWLAFANLNNGAIAGLAALNANNGLGTGNWNILARLSGKAFFYHTLHGGRGKQRQTARPPGPPLARGQNCIAEPRGW